MSCVELERRNAGRFVGRTSLRHEKTTRQKNGGAAEGLSYQCYRHSSLASWGRDGASAGKLQRPLLDSNYKTLSKMERRPEAKPKKVRRGKVDVTLEE
ncbi:hypothetical protein GGTG_03682 [Gaeumannomyces tritici R3-111a-1]|uniref:Uncharacterized protein n=1 Tax=Gaeumannomyces tritici (strain R3-111a-1) TaxID=644352 RepID=J3NQX7_GAET3|nr:hypothetical protein GGTG_03682 [Gaeumannomyces tritici R3-111a-1]EJT78583.1 hypothetical protein GGTG_03682 [Gaeumannomyces tritici R3-111a-1]